VANRTFIEEYGLCITLRPACRGTEKTE